VRRSKLGAWPDELREHVDHRAHLVVAVIGGLDDCAVETHCDVVDEDAAVDAAEVDATLGSIVEHVERGDDVVAVDPEIECEVVPCPGGNAHEGNVVLGRDSSHRGL
jgi:hypothetical protein